MKNDSRLSDWGNGLWDLLKYPLAIILFNMSLYVFLKTKMIDGKLEIVLREATPSFF